MTTTTRTSRREAGPGVHALGHDATLRLRGPGLALRVTAGCVLVTREGDPEDHVLEAGGALALDGRGLAVAWALAPATVTVAALAPPGPRRARGRQDAMGAASPSTMRTCSESSQSSVST